MGTEPGKAGVDLASKLAEIDMQSLYAEHIQMWGVFANAIRLMLLVMSLPFLSGGVLVSARAIDISELSDPRHLPQIVTLITLGSGVLGIFMLLVVIHYRLDVLLYARAINDFRGFYLKILYETDVQFLALKPDMPISSDVPSYFEPFREVGILVFGFACVNTAYITLATINLNGRFLDTFATDQGDFWRNILIAGFVLVLVGVQYLAYYLLTKRKPIAGYQNYHTKKIA